MSGVEPFDTLYLAAALLYYIILIVHFALRKWCFESYVMRYGWLVYALALPFFLVSLALLYGGKAWALWLGGVLYLVWSLFGFSVEYVKHVEWRTPIRWEVFGPYILLYLATAMFYWWPVALISRPLWYVVAFLFAVSTLLNIRSHRKPGQVARQASRTTREDR